MSNATLHEGTENNILEILFETMIYFQYYFFLFQKIFLLKNNNSYFQIVDVAWEFPDKSINTAEIGDVMPNWSAIVDIDGVDTDPRKHKKKKKKHNNTKTNV